MGGLCTSRGVGQYVAAEAHTLAYGRLYKQDGSKRPLIYFTGGNGDDRDFLTTPASGSQIAPALADRGVPMISAAFGGTYEWGNDTAIARIGQAWTYVKAQLSPKQDQFVGIGVSKGATALLNYARANPANVAALLLIVPAVDVSDIHDNNRGGNAAGIETAFGGAAGWASAAATHDPSLNLATHKSQSIPIKMLYGGGDTVITPASVKHFADGTGALASQISPTTDHLTTAPAIDPDADVWTFLGSYV